MFCVMLLGKEPYLLCRSVSMQQLGGGGAPMQPGQVAPNQNFLNRAPGPIPVSHSNVQQQVRELARCWFFCLFFPTLAPLSPGLLLTPLLPGLRLIYACLIGNPFLQCAFRHTSTCVPTPPPPPPPLCPVCSLWWWACPPLVRSL